MFPNSSVQIPARSERPAVFVLAPQRHLPGGGSRRQDGPARRLLWALAQRWQVDVAVAASGDDSLDVLAPVYSKDGVVFEFVSNPFLRQKRAPRLCLFIGLESLRHARLFKLFHPRVPFVAFLGPSLENPRPRRREYGGYRENAAYLDAVWTTAECDALAPQDLPDWIERKIAALARSVPNPLATKRPPKASVIILFHNALRYGRRCLEFLKKSDSYPDREYLFIDNASRDATRGYLRSMRARFKNARIIRNHDNVGFARGCNQGLREAKGEFLVLLNSDVLVTPFWLEGLVQHAINDPGAGAVLPRMVGGSGALAANKSDAAKPPADFLRFSQVHALRHGGARTEVTSHPFACVLLRRSLVDEIGLLDERFILGGCEDEDYCFRIVQRGYKVIVAQDILMHHFRHKSFRSPEDRRSLLRFNRALLLDKWAAKPFEFMNELLSPMKTRPSSV